MKDILVKIYMNGFEEDGEKYAKFFCSLNYENAVVFPPDNPVSAGYVIERELSNGAKCAYFSAIATHESKRGKGYASKLIAEMLYKSQSKGYPFVILSPFHSEFYKKYGFFTTQYCKEILINGYENLEISSVTEQDIEDINSMFDPLAIRCVFDNAYILSIQKEASIYNGKPIKILRDGKTVGFCVCDEINVGRIVQRGTDVTNIANFNGSIAKIPARDGEAFIQIRIVVLEEFIKFLRPKINFECVLYVSDGIISENNGVWRFRSNGDLVEAEKLENVSANIVVNIGNLADYLVNKGFIEPIKTQFIDEY